MVKQASELCPSCKGTIFPFSHEDPHRCTCVGEDYEQCGTCGFDHQYDLPYSHVFQRESEKAHEEKDLLSDEQAILGEQEEPIDQLN